MPTIQKGHNAERIKGLNAKRNCAFLYCNVEFGQRLTAFSEFSEAN